MSEGREQRVFVEIVTEEDAVNYIREKVRELYELRIKCDVRPPGDKVTAARIQKRRYDHWRIQFGRAIGSLDTLMHCRKISQSAYEELRVQTLSTATPTVVGFMGKN